MHGLRVTLKPPDDDSFTTDAILTMATGQNGGQVYSSPGGFWIEVIEAGDGSQRVADFGWQDGKRDHVVTDVVPVSIS
jgi:hypothetical protein